MNRRLLPLILAAVHTWILCLPNVARADDSTTDAGIEFFRSEVPAAQIADVTDDHRIMKREEFEQLVKQGQLRSVDTGRTASIQRATYRARLRTDYVLEGTAQLDIESPTDQSTLLTLKPLGIVVNASAWEDRTTPARLGRTGQHAAVIVNNGEQLLNFDWSLRSGANRDRGIEFAFALPKAVTTTLVLEIPQKFQLICDRGVVTPLTKDAVMMSDDRLWRIELGPDADNFLLRLVATRDSSNKLVFLKQKQQWTVGRHAVDLLANLHLDVYDEPIDRLQLRVSNELTLQDVTFSNRRAKWQAIHSDDQVTLYDVKLASDLVGQGQIVRVACRAPTNVDTLWRLPSVAVGNAFWRDGTTSLIIADSLQLLDLQPSGMRYRTHEKTPGASSYSFDAFSPDAEIQLHVAYRLPQLICRLGTSTVLQETSCSSQTTAVISAASGEVFEFECTVPASWNGTEIPITFSPESMVSSYQLSRSANANGRKLVVRLDQPLTAERSLTMELSGLRRGVRRKISSDMLPLLSFSPDHDTQQYLWLRAPRRTRMEIANDHGIQRMAVADLSAAEQRLTNAPMNASVYLLPPDQNFDIRTRLSDASFAGNIRYTLVASSDAVREVITASCVPIAGELDSIYVHFLHADENPITWQATTDVGEVTAQKLSSQEQQALALAGGETWKIELKSPQDATFTIEGTRDRKRTGDIPIAFPTLLATETQRGVLIVDDTLQPVTVEGDDLRPLPPPTKAASTREFVYAANALPEAYLRWPAKTGAHMVVWNCALHSAFEASGRAIHTAKFQIENLGASQVELSMPAGSRLLALHVNEERVAHAPQQSQHTVRIPAQTRWVDVGVRFETREDALYWITQLQPSLPLLDARPVNGTWTVEYPNNCARFVTDDPFALDDRGSLMYRLFGPFARSETAPLSDVKIVEETSSSQFFSAGGVTPSITVIGRNYTMALAWSAFVIAASFFWWLGNYTLRWALLFTPVALLCSLLIPLPLVPISVLTLGGCVLGTFASMLPRRTTRRPEVARGEIASAVGASACLLFAFLAYSPAMADDPDAPASVKSPYEVLVPVDQEGEAQDSYYLPAPLYAALRRLQQPPTADDIPVITDAMYDIQLVAGTTEESFELAPVRATLTVYVPVASRSVRIPFRKADMRVADVRVGGRQITFRWTKATDALELEFEDEGEIEVTIEFSPINDVIQKQRLDLPIPPIPSSRILASVPSGAPNLAFPQSLGAITHDSDRRTYNVQHGPAKRLVVDWSGTAAAYAQPNAPTLQLTWLTIEPGAAVVDLQLQYPPQDQDFPSLDIDVDPRLRVIRTVVNGVMRESTMTRVGNLNRVAISINETVDVVTSGMTINASFLVTEASGMGHLLIPQISPAKQPAVKHWLGISVASELELDTTFDEDVDFLTPREFQEAWGKDDDTLRLAADLSTTFTPGTIKTFFRQTQLAVDERVDLMAAYRMADISYNAAVDVREGEVGQLTWLVPESCRVESIEVQQSDRSIPTTWTRADGGQLVATVAQPLRDEFTVELKARVEFPQAGSPLPTIWLDQDASRTHHVNVYQTSAAQVSVAVDGPGMQALEITEEEMATASPLWPTAAFLINDYQAIAASKLVTRRNRVVVKGVSLTALNSEDAQWVSRFTFAGQVTQGRLDSVQLQCPIEWGDDFTVSAGYDVEVGNQSVGLTRSILVRKRHGEPLRGPFQFTLAAAYTPVDEELTLLPTIYTPGIEAVQRFIALPKSLGDQNVTWNFNGLRQTAVPSPFAEQAELSQFTVFRVTKDTYRAALQQDSEQIDPPQIGLLDCQLQIAGTRAWQGCMSVTIRNPPTPRCVVRVPSNVEVLEVLVDSKVADTSMSDDLLSIAFGKQRLPITCEILFRGTFPDGRVTDAGTLPLLEVVNIPVEETIISVANSDPRMAWKPRGKTCSTSEHHVRQLADVAATITYALSNQLAASKETRERWYAYWIEQYADARQRVILQRSLLASGSDTLVQELDRQQLQLADKLGLTATCQAALAKPQDERNFAAERTRAAASRFTICQPGSAAVISLALVPRHVRISATEEWLSRIAIFMFACTGCLLIRRHHVVSLIHRFGFGLILAAGLFWFIYLQPSFVGIALLVVSLALAFLPRFYRN